MYATDTQWDVNLKNNAIVLFLVKFLNKNSALSYWRLLVCLKRLKPTFYEIVLSTQLALKGPTERCTILQCFFPMWLAVAVLCWTNFIIGGSNLPLTAYVLFRVNELLLLLVLWLARATGHACYYVH